MKVLGSKARYPACAFRIWHGMTADVWWRLLMRNRFAVSPYRCPMAFEISLYSLLNSLLGAIQHLIYGRRIDRVTISPAPIFIVGHWRSGTTLLHELMSLNEQLVTPRTYECFAPSHALVTKGILRRLTFLLPDRRPMDDVAVGWERPQEDEFALMNLGVRSIYEVLAFPNHRSVAERHLKLETLSEKEQERWRAAFLRFCKQVTLRAELESETKQEKGKRKILVLKSPPHTAKLASILKLFPQARFIHLVRDPNEVFPSTMKLWKTLTKVQGLQAPKWELLPDGTPSLEEFVLRSFDVIYEAFRKESGLVPPEQLCEVRYEDLLSAPISELERIYQHLRIEDFESCRTAVSKYLENAMGFRRDRHLIEEPIKSKVSQRWSGFIRAYGYDKPSKKPSSNCALLGQSQITRDQNL